MSYSIPRPVYERLAATLKDRTAAEEFAGSIEEAVRALEHEVRRETMEKTVLMKTEVKEDLSKILVTRDLFEQRFESMQEAMNQRFLAVDEKFLSMQQHIDQRFQFVDERFKRMEVWLKVLVGLSVFGITMANPGFMELIKGLFR